MFRHGKIEEKDSAKLEKVYQSQKEVSMLIEAIQKEKAQIRAQGERVGTRKRNLKIAQTMLQNGALVEKIKLYTGLSNEVIAKLKKTPR